MCGAGEAPLASSRFCVSVVLVSIPQLGSAGDCPARLHVHCSPVTWLFIWGRAGMGPTAIPISLIYVQPASFPLLP